jgi:hypothetical protein
MKNPRISKVALLACAATMSVACADAPADLEIVYLADEDELSAAKSDGDDEPKVELKVSLPADEHARALWKFRLDEDRATVREVTFYDDPWLSLYEDGIILRSRKVIDGPDDSTVKIRPLAVDEVDPAWFSESGFQCEEDRSVGELGVSSCSLTREQDRGEIDDVADGERTVKKLFAEDQEDFVEAYAGELDWSALEAYGPVDTLKWRIEVSGFDHKLTFERWFLPDGRELLEVSSRVDADEALEAEEDLERFLRKRGFSTQSAGISKTSAVLEYFAAH